MTSFSTFWAECLPEVLPEFLQRMKEAWSSELESELIAYYRNDQEFQKGLNEVSASLKKLAPDDGKADKELRDSLRQLHRWLSRGPKVVRSVVRGNSDRFEMTMGSRHLFAELCKSTERFIATASEVAKYPPMRANLARIQSDSAGNLDNKDESVALSELGVTSEKPPHIAEGAAKNFDVGGISADDLVALLEGVSEKTLNSAASRIAAERKQALANVFSKVAKRQRWKDVLKLDLGQLEGAKAVAKVNEWLVGHIDDFREESDERKDEIATCLREIKDEFNATYFAYTRSEAANVAVTITTEDESSTKDKKRRFVLRRKGRGRGSRQGLPELELKINTPEA